MKELRGMASETVAASRGECFALLADVEGYPRWYHEGVRDVRILERAGGRATRANAVLRAAVGPTTRDFSVLVAVQAREPDSVRLERVPHDHEDQEAFGVFWHLRGDGPTTIEVSLEATLSVPRLLPVGGLADGMARGFVQAASRELATRG